MISKVISLFFFDSTIFFLLRKKIKLFFTKGATTKSMEEGLLKSMSDSMCGICNPMKQKGITIQVNGSHMHTSYVEVKYCKKHFRKLVELLSDEDDIKRRTIFCDACGRRPQKIDGRQLLHRCKAEKGRFCAFCGNHLRFGHKDNCWFKNDLVLQSPKKKIKK